MTTFQMMRKASGMPEILQFQEHHCHSLMQTKHQRNAENFCWGDIIIENCLQIQGKGENC
jgi:hypothetical protein